MQLTETIMNWDDSRCEETWTNPNNGMVCPMHYITIDGNIYWYEYFSDCTIGSVYLNTDKHENVDGQSCEDYMTREEYDILCNAIEAAILKDYIEHQTAELMLGECNPNIYTNIVKAIADGCLDSHKDSFEDAFYDRDLAEIGLFIRAAVTAYWEIQAINKVKGEVQ